MRLPLAGLLTLLLLDVGVAVILYQGPGVMMEPDQAVAASAETVSDERSELAGSTKPMTVAVFGDSFALGAGTSTKANSWVSLLAESKGWQLTNLAGRQSGYVSGRTCGSQPCPTFVQRVQSTDVAAPDLIVVSGGRADGGQDPALEDAAIDQFYRVLRATYPRADIVATNPLWASTEPPPTLAAVGASVKAAVTKVGGVFIDLGQPLRAQPRLVANGGTHPNDDGHLVLFDAVSSALSDSELDV